MTLLEEVHGIYDETIQRNNSEETFEMLKLTYTTHIKEAARKGNTKIHYTFAGTEKQLNKVSDYYIKEGFSVVVCDGPAFKEISISW